jgi:hypothetical protein
VLFLCSEDAPSRVVLSAGGGSIAAAAMFETAPQHFGDGELSPESIAQHYAQIADWSTAQLYESANAEIGRLVTLAARARG